MVIARWKERYLKARERRWVRWGSDLMLLGVVVLAIGVWQTRDLVRGPAPAFSLQTLSGQTVTSASLKGKPVLLAFWAPWCAVCKTESQNISWVQRLVGDRVRVLSVASSWDQLEQVKGYVADHAVDYPVLLDTSELATAFHVSAFPTVYFLDADGQVKHSAVGYTTTLGLLARVLLP